MVTQSVVVSFFFEETCIETKMYNNKSLTSISMQLTFNLFEKYSA